LRMVSLHGMLRNGMNKRNSKRLTLHQIAEMAGTSKSTVSRVLTNDPHVSPETRRRVQEVIDRHGFRPNLFARGLRGARTGQIAVIGRWMERGFLADVIKGMDMVASRHDAHLLSCLAHGPEDYISLWRRFAVGGQVDGIILVAPPLKILDHQVEPGDIPLTLCACHASRNRRGWNAVDAVSLNNVGAKNAILEHLLEQGCRYLVYLEGTADTYDARERVLCFQRFVESHPDVVGEIVRDATWRDTARMRTLEFLEKSPVLPDAFLAYNDMVAVGALEALRQRGIRVPEDVAVSGFDDANMAEFIGLTTVHVPGVLIGQEAARLLFMRLDEEEESRIARHTIVELTPKIRRTSLFAQGRHRRFPRLEQVSQDAG